MIQNIARRVTYSIHRWLRLCHVRDGPRINIEEFEYAVRDIVFLVNW